MKKENDRLKAELEAVRATKVNKRPHSSFYEQIKDDGEKILQYTTLSIGVFNILVRMLLRFDITYVQAWSVKCLTMHEQLLLVLMKFKLNLRDFDLAQRFGISKTTVSIIFRTLVHALHEFLIEGIMESEHGLPSALKCAQSLPSSFKDFSSARIVMDATEISQDIPSNLNENREAYSAYKGRHTLKAVTCVAPNGVLVYASPLYPGSTSDTAIVKHCKILDKMSSGDLILADKGFPIYDQLPPGVHLNLPPFLTAKSQFTQAEANMAMKIARARIHVERANERIKNFSILDHIPARYRNISSKIFQVCSYLINLQSPLLKEMAGRFDIK